MKYPNNMKNIIMASALLASLSTSYGVGVTLDGYLSVSDSYSNKVSIYFYNGHEPEAYGIPNSPTDPPIYQTYVHWEIGKLSSDPTGDDYFFMYVETPIEVKNMVWGDEVTPADILEYDVHFENHHPGKDPTMDYKQATGSEFMAFEDMNGDQQLKSELKQTGGLDSVGYGMIAGRTSLDYLLANGASETTSTALGRTVGMGFEYQFTKDDVTNNALLDIVRDNGIIEYHLSPERGLVPTQVPDDPEGPPIPEPSTAMLGVLGLVLILRRRLR